MWRELRFFWLAEAILVHAEQGLDDCRAVCGRERCKRSRSDFSTCGLPSVGSGVEQPWPRSRRPRSAQSGERAGKACGNAELYSRASEFRPQRVAFSRAHAGDDKIGGAPRILRPMNGAMPFSTRAARGSTPFANGREFRLDGECDQNSH